MQDKVNRKMEEIQDNQIQQPTETSKEEKTAKRLCIASTILMIIARVKYPKNKFAKTLMWAFIILYVVSIVTSLCILGSFAMSVAKSERWP